MHTVTQVALPDQAVKMAEKSSFVKFIKACGVSFKHKEWGFGDGHALKARRNLPKDCLEVLDKIAKDFQHKTNKSYCDVCINHVRPSCRDCGRERNICFEDKAV